MNHYVFFIWNQEPTSKRGTLVTTTQPETLGRRIRTNKVNDRVTFLYRDAKGQLRIALLDITPSKPSLSPIKKSLTTVLSSLGYVMSQSARKITTTHHHVTLMMIDEHTLTLEELEADFTMKGPEYLKFML